MGVFDKALKTVTNAGKGAMNTSNNIGTTGQFGKKKKRNYYYL